MQESKKYILGAGDYHLDKASNCVSIRGLSEILLHEIALITNVTTNTIIYNPHCEGMGGHIAENNVVFDFTLTDAMTDDDELMIIIQKNIPLGGSNGLANVVIEENSHTQRDILLQLKLIKEILSRAFEIEVEEREIKT